MVKRREVTGGEEGQWFTVMVEANGPKNRRIPERALGGSGGLIDHVCRFNKAYGYREGWIFSNRLSRALNHLTELIQGFKERKDSLQKQKDRDLFMYL